MTDAAKKGFAKAHRAISIRDQAQIRNLDSKKGMPRFDNFKIQFYSSILDTFSTASTLKRHSASAAAPLPGGFVDLRYSVEVFSDIDSLEQVLDRLRDLEAARAAYVIASRIRARSCCAGSTAPLQSRVID